MIKLWCVAWNLTNRVRRPRNAEKSKNSFLLKAFIFDHLARNVRLDGVQTVSVLKPYCQECFFSRARSKHELETDKGKQRRTNVYKNKFRLQTFFLRNGVEVRWMNGLTRKRSVHNCAEWFFGSITIIHLFSSSSLLFYVLCSGFDPNINLIFIWTPHPKWIAATHKSKPLLAIRFCFTPHNFALKFKVIEVD